MKFHLENRYQDSGWMSMREEFVTFAAADLRATECSHNSIIYGMVRVVGPDGNVLVTYGAGSDGVPMMEPEPNPDDHTSPNGAEPGSLVHAAEEWMLLQGLKIPLAGKYPHLFQGMLDDFGDSDDYDCWGY